MMNFFRYILFFIFATQLFALDIDVKIGKDGGGKYSTLSMSSEEEFYCEQDKDFEKPINSYTCVFKSFPKEPVKSIETQFFYLFPYQKNGSLVLSVKPKRKSKIFSYDYDPTTNETKQQGFKTNARKFVIVSYENYLPFVVQKQGVGINFPVSLDSDEHPYVKSLDINGMPINENPALNDLKEYAGIKKLMDKGEYKDAIKEIDKILKIFPNSIFVSEYELFRLKSGLALASVQGVAEVIPRAKEWLRLYPTDEKTAEVLLILANAYAKSQDFNNASYYFDRVINDYENTEISKQAMVDLGDAMRASKPRSASELYKRALFKTKDIKIASSAAFKLADTHLMLKDGKNAALYAEKILKGNPDYLLKDKAKAFELAKSLAKFGQYQIAYEITNLLLKNTQNKPETSIEYEELLFSIGNYALESGDIDGAKSFYERYLREFPAGKNSSAVQSVLDRMNFGTIEAKDAKNRIADYDDMMKKYPNDPIAKQALVKKADLLFSQNRCDELVSIKGNIKALPADIAAPILPKIASCERQKAISLLKRGDCIEALNHMKTNSITLEAAYDEQMYDCLLKTSRYGEAKSIAGKHFSESDPNRKLYWMMKAQKTYSREGEHKDVITLSRDILTLASALKQPSYNVVAFDMFASAVSLQNTEAMLESTKIVENLYPNMPESLFVYKEMIKFAIRKNDNLTALNYSKKMYELQNSLKVYTDTPWLEFTYSELANKQGDTNGAILALASLKDKKLSSNDKARQLYNASVLWQKQGKKETAKKLLTECSGLKEDSSWRKLCKDGLELFQ